MSAPLREPACTAPRYEIRVAGQLDPVWAGWFEGMNLANLPAEGVVLIWGPVPDQSALHGLLARVRDLNLTLVSVRRIDPED
jgi:hypothetical protein